MATREITLTLSEELIRKAESIAAARGETLDAMMGELIEGCPMKSAESYAEAMREALADMDNPLDLGTNGQITWTRESLHERR